MFSSRTSNNGMPILVQKIMRPGLLAVFGLTLGACRFIGGEDGMLSEIGIGGEEGLFSDDGGYQAAEIIPDMRIPPELDSYTIDQLYVIPEPFSPDATAFEEIPLPKPIEERRREGVIIQSLSGVRWILIDATPGQVWPLIRDYWTELQIALDYENPSAGILETAWVEIGSDEENRHKYRIQIEPGLHSGYAEVYVLHLQNLRTDPIPTIITWPEESSSVDLEQDMLRSVSQFLADRNDIYQASSASLLAGTIQAESKANIIAGVSGDPVLELKVDYNRAWVQIRQALQSANINIVDENRDQSFFSVRFAGIAEEQDEPGWFGRILGRDGEVEESEEQDFSIRLLETGNVVNVVTEALLSNPSASQLNQELLQVINDNLS
jgi:outer membrane protein assembly factor BamC